MSKKKESIEYAGIVDKARGKLGGRNSLDSGRVRFGRRERYHWDPVGGYKEVPARRAENKAFGEAIKGCSAIMKDAEKKAAYEKAWEANKEGYDTLRGYLIAKIRKGEIKVE